MIKKTDFPLKQTLWQLPVLVLLALCFALGLNHWRSDSIPLVGDWSEATRFSDASGESMVISLDQARQLFEQNGALFMDARPADQYAEEHIQGALSIPWQEAELYFEQAIERLESAKTIISYCDGETCELSHDLALFFKEMGFENVRVLVNGLSVWQQAELPTEGDN